MCPCPVFAFLLDDPLMMLLFGALAVMLFGERLPEVARSIGKQFMEVQERRARLARRNHQRHQRRHHRSTRPSRARPITASRKSAKKPLRRSSSRPPGDFCGFRALSRISHHGVPLLGTSSVVEPTYANTARSEQWHTVAALPWVLRNAAYFTCTP